MGMRIKFDPLQSGQSRCDSSIEHPDSATQDSRIRESKAKNPMSSTQRESSTGTVEQSEVDVVIAGAGACGLIAAIRAAQLGASVALVEKLDHFDGDTTRSTGTIPAAGTRLQREAGITDNVDDMVADIERITGPHDMTFLNRLLCEQSAPVVEWLMDHCGVRFKLYTTYMHIGHQTPRLHIQPGGKGMELLDSLDQAVRRAGISIAYSTPVRQLLLDSEGRVTGVEVESAGVRRRILAKKTILASGGFGGNDALLREYCPEIAGAPFFGAPGSQGEAIEWGRALGARLANIGAYQPHGSVAYPQRHLLTWSAAEMGAFYVNRSGKRFGNENVGYSGFGAKVMAQNNEAYAIYDARIRDFIGENLETYKNLVKMGGAQEAATVEQLAALHGIDAANLARTLESYTRAAKGLAPDEFGRTKFGMAPLVAPFVVTRVHACLFHTQGGLMVDAQAHVMKTDGQPIPNLLAGGGAAACISGKSGGAGYVSGNGLLTASVLGYIAGETAAREIADEKNSRG